MKLTLILNSAPRFHYWKDFGAGKKRRVPFFKHWWDTWRYRIARKETTDYTLSLDKLPPGSRIMEAEDFMDGPIDAMPEEILKMKYEPTVLSHPWPFNVQLDPIESQKLMYTYTIDTRFFVPKDDCLALTNTILETEQMQARPPIEPTSEDLENITRQYEWATSMDSILLKKPKKREWPRIDQKPAVIYGITKDRQETSVLNSLNDYSQTVMAQYYHKKQDREKLSELLDRKMIAFPRCMVPFERDSKSINLDLCIDIMSISQKPLAQINPTPQDTTNSSLTDIRPRSWRSLLEQTRKYSPNWSFTLPRNSFLNTIHLSSRLILAYRDVHEMMARAIIHSYGLTTQYARLRCYEKQILATKSDESRQSSVVLQNPLSFEALREQDNRDLLEEPIVLQTIGFEEPTGNFYFTRYQLNTIKPDGEIKNQAWHSGPISDLREALRYYLDFQSFDSERASKTRLEAIEPAAPAPASSQTGQSATTTQTATTETNPVT